MSGELLVAAARLGLSILLELKQGGQTDVTVAGQTVSLDSLEVESVDEHLEKVGISEDEIQAALEGGGL